MKEWCTIYNAEHFLSLLIFSETFIIDLSQKWILFDFLMYIFASDFFEKGEWILCNQNTTR